MVSLLCPSWDIVCLLCRCGVVEARTDVVSSACCGILVSIRGLEQGRAGVVTRSSLGSVRWCDRFSSVKKRPDRGRRSVYIF